MQRRHAYNINLLGGARRIRHTMLPAVSRCTCMNAGASWAILLMVPPLAISSHPSSPLMPLRADVSFSFLHSAS